MTTSPPARERSTQDVWRERVAQWRASGESASQFASTRGFAASTLRMYASKLSQPERPRFARVLTPAPRVAAPSEIVIEVAAARVRVTPGFDPALLASVVAALSAGAR